MRKWTEEYGMSVVKVTDQYGITKYHIQLEKINYVEYIKLNALFGGGYYEVVFSGEEQQRLSLTEDQGRKVIKALNELRG